MILRQFLLYLVVGGLSFVVDIAVFVALYQHIDDRLASVAGFLTATCANYFLSYLLAFQRGRFGRANEVARLFAVAGIGLVLNTAFFELFVRIGLHPVVAKVVAVPIVLIWNFLGRRLFVFHHSLPEHGLPFPGRRPPMGAEQ
ncbi:MAG: hypothetical protein OHK0024_11020 [Thalassobaculales bacterium]